MGQVWLATDERLERSVAVKIVLPDAADAQLGLRLEREARSAAAIQHTNVVRVFDYLDDAGRTLIVMEHVDGETLSDRLDRDGALSLEDSLDIAAQICDGLSAAHRAGLVHRDLKPSNVMVTGDGLAKVLDFGIAKRTGRGEANLTMTGAVIGTPRYMSPEQLRGEELDARVDVHAVGLLLYEMLTGRPAFDRENFAELMYQLVNAGPDGAALLERGVPAEVIAIIDRAAAKSRDDRFPDARSMSDALRVCLFGDLLTGRKSPSTAGLRGIIDSGERVLQRNSGSGSAIPSPEPSALPEPDAPAPVALVPPAARTMPDRRVESARWPLIVVPGVVAALVLAVIGYRATRPDTTLRGTIASAPASSGVSPSPDTSARSAERSPALPAAVPADVAPAATAAVSAPTGAAASESTTPSTPQTAAAAPPTTGDEDRDAEARGTEFVRRAVATAVAATWRFYLGDVTKEYGDGINDLQADFDVVVDQRGQFSSVRPGALSDAAIFVENASAAVQNSAPIKIGSARRNGGWPMRVRFIGKSVRVVTR